jgi:hypothetical protein
MHILEDLDILALHRPGGATLGLGTVSLAVYLERSLSPGPLVAGRRARARVMERKLEMSRYSPRQNLE